MKPKRRKPASVRSTFTQPLSLKALASLVKKVGGRSWDQVLVGEELEVGVQNYQMARTEGAKISERRETEEKWTHRSTCNWLLRYLPTPKMCVSMKKLQETQQKKPQKPRSWGAIEMHRNSGSPMMLRRQRLELKPSQVEDLEKHSRFSAETQNVHSQE